MHRIVVDANVWVKYARVNSIAPLLRRVAAYRLASYANNYLLSEVFTAVVENGWMKEKSAHVVLQFIRDVSVIRTERAVYRLSPDPKDNYLFDLAIQNNCAFIVSDDTLLLSFRMKPVPVHSSNWFMKTFSLV